MATHTTSANQEHNAALVESHAARVCMHVIGTARTDERVLREATALRSAGFEVTIVDVERDSTMPKIEAHSGVTLKHVIMPSRFVRTRFKPFFLVKTARLIMRAGVEMARIPADVYHAHDDNALPAAYVAACLRRKPLILDAHELPLSEPSVTRRRLLHWLAVRVTRYMARRCSGIITVSDPIAREIRTRFGGPPAVVIRNVPVYQAPAPANDEIRTYLGVTAQTGVAVFQGALHANRALDLLVHAARWLDQRNVIALIGSGPAQTSLQTLIEAEGVADRVRIIPPVPYDQLLRWTASADVGLILYRASHSLNVRYCLPNKLFEYFMAGVPVLASRLDAVNEIITTYDAGRIVDSLDPPVVAQAINSMLDDRQSLARMRTNALAAARDQFRWDVEQRQLLDLYRDVLRA